MCSSLPPGKRQKLIVIHKKNTQWADPTYVRSRTSLGRVTSLHCQLETLQKTIVIHRKNRVPGQHLPGQHLPGQHTYLTSRSPFTITILLRTQLWTTSLAPSGAICGSSIYIYIYIYIYKLDPLHISLYGSLYVATST